MNSLLGSWLFSSLGLFRRVSTIPSYIESATALSDNGKSYGKSWRSMVLKEDYCKQFRNCVRMKRQVYEGCTLFPCMHGRLYT